MQEIWKSDIISDCFQKETKCRFFRGRKGKKLREITEMEEKEDKYMTWEERGIMAVVQLSIEG